MIHHVEKHAGDAELLWQYFKGVHAAFKTEFADEDVDALMKVPVLCHAYLMPARTRFAAPGHASTRTSSGPPPSCEYYFLAPSTVLESERCCTIVGEPHDENAMHKVVAHEYAGVFLERYGAVIMLFLHDEFGKTKVRSVLVSKQPTFGKALTAELGVTSEQLTARWNRWRRKTLARK